MITNSPVSAGPVVEVPGVFDVGAGRDRGCEDSHLAQNCRAVVAGRQAADGLVLEFISTNIATVFDVGDIKLVEQPGRAALAGRQIIELVRGL